MREILFRGKRKDNGEWVYGSLHCFKGFSIFDFDCKRFVPVSSKTVGQYTGLNDRDSERIFEGDIVAARFVNNKFKTVFLVNFEDGAFKFGNNYVNVPRRDIYNLKVIGNIHDNPELFKKGEENDE